MLGNANVRKEEVYTFHWRINQCSIFPVALSDFFPHFIPQVKSGIPYAGSSLTLHCLNAWSGDAMKQDHEPGYQAPGSRTWNCLAHSSTWYFRWRLCLWFGDSNGLFYYLLHSLFMQFPHYKTSFFIIISFNHLKTERLKLDLYFYSDTAARYHCCHLWRNWRDCRTSYKLERWKWVKNSRLGQSFLTHLW